MTDQNKTKGNLDKHHKACLALLSAGYGVGHGTIQGVQIPRVIRPFEIPRAGKRRVS